MFMCSARLSVENASKVGSARLFAEHASNSPIDCIRTVQIHAKKYDGFCILTQAKLTYSHTQTNASKLTNYISTKDKTL